MDHILNASQRNWQLIAREFAEKEVRPIVLRQDQIEDPADCLDWELIRRGSKLNFRTAALPKAYGGQEVDLVTQVTVLIELSRADSGVAKAFSQCWKWSRLMSTICSEEQKLRFLPEFVSNDTYLLGRGMTESNAGSDNRIPPPSDPRSGFRTRAHRDGDVWIVNGEKQFISHGPAASLFLLDVRTNIDASIVDGSSLFLLPRGTPGFTIGKVYNKAGWRFYQNAELVLNNAEVPHANLIGEVNGGLKGSAGDKSGTGELELAACALGLCDSALDLAKRYIAERRAPSIDVAQAIELRLTELAILTESLRALLLTTAQQWDYANANDIARDQVKGALTVVLGAKAIVSVSRMAMEIIGTAGGEMNLLADKLVRDAGIWPHMVGDSVNKLIAARRVLSTLPKVDADTRREFVEVEAPA